ncbi:MAG: hypothetical protein F6K63_00125 [Moorea sp. SIO1G6]|uniref:hypothetical protein n=1 Tax=Moorena sp. SIO1G6 TaxID=2607840 RepID=UPI0013C165E3|nr:hypothetical protein [Moorena sp. SIO1G6]NET62884.1 hypothetical protein [Moorena sp. SIO1G6]
MAKRPRYANNLLTLAKRPRYANNLLTFNLITFNLITPKKLAAEIISTARNFYLCLNVVNPSRCDPM